MSYRFLCQIKIKLIIITIIIIIKEFKLNIFTSIFSRATERRRKLETLEI